MLTALNVIYLSMIAASISFTVSETKLFKTLREKVNEKSNLLGSLLSCGYCFGHWAAFALVAIYRPKLVEAWWLLDYFLTALLIAWLAAFQWVMLCWLMKNAGK